MSARIAMVLAGLGLALASCSQPERREDPSRVHAVAEQQQATEPDLGAFRTRGAESHDSTVRTLLATYGSRTEPIIETLFWSPFYASFPVEFESGRAPAAGSRIHGNMWTPIVPGDIDTARPALYQRALVASSRAPEDSPHGGTLFSLRTTAAINYLLSVERGYEVPAGTHVIMEAWDSFRSEEHDIRHRYGHRGLYIMSKYAGDSAGTDGGWLYTVAVPTGRDEYGEAEGWSIRESGMLASCVGCHSGAPGGTRLFGLGRPTVVHDPATGMPPLDDAVEQR